MSSSQPESGSSGGLSPYVEMLLSFGKVPKWHTFLSTLLIWMLTTGFIITPSTLIDFKSEDSTINGQPVLTNVLVLAVSSVPLFAIGTSLVVVGLIGMYVLSRYRYLKGNYFWLYNKYYLRIAEGGICGLVLFFETILQFRNDFSKIGLYKIAGPTIAVIAAICITCIIKVVYSGLAVWSYFKTRRAMKAHEVAQRQEDKPQTEDPYVQMLLGSVSLPGWHNLLSTLLILLITTGFVTIPPILVELADVSSETNLFKEFVLSEPQFGICVSIFFVGFAGMYALSRYRYLKNNHFWLYHNYYRRMVEAGIYGVITILVNVFIFGAKNIDPPILAVICVTCIVTALYSGLAGWSYFKMRRAMKAHETPQVERPITEEPQSEKLQAEVSHISGSP